MRRHLELDAALDRRLECVPTGRYKMTPTTTNRQFRVREGRQTRDAILTAAKRLMLIKGYNATSLDDLLGASGVGKGSFYHYFESKEDLRSEEHTSELQSRFDLVCRLLLEKKKVLSICSR